MKGLEANLHSVQQRIGEAAVRAGREPSDVTLVGVTKTQSPQVIQAAYELGLRHFGENRVEEAEEKTDQLPADITWHMIGHVQSRKAQRVASRFGVVHSLDSLKLARRLDRFSADRCEPLPVLLELNVSGEASKYGFSANEWWSGEEHRYSLLSAIEEIIALPHVSVQGLMTMAPIVAEPEEARPVFVRLRAMRDDLSVRFPHLDWRHLSMGMTDDFEVAIEEGATMVRVGRALFAPDLPPWRKG